jgi:hypothetical protein
MFTYTSDPILVDTIVNYGKQNIKERIYCIITGEEIIQFINVMQFYCHVMTMTLKIDHYICFQ